MNLEQFWLMIEQSRVGTANAEAQIVALETAVRSLQPQEMVSFEGHCWDVLSISFRRELWAIIAIIEPGCSQASFDAVRAWLILQGKQFFDQVTAHPERIAERIPRGSTPWIPGGDLLLRLVPHNYRQMTGEEMPTVPRKVPYVIKGARWSDHDLPDMHPELWKKYR